MNRIRRREITGAIKLVEEARGILETVMEEEQEAYDNMPEGLQESEQGEQLEENVALLEGVVDQLETAADEAGELL